MSGNYYKARSKGISRIGCLVVELNHFSQIFSLVLHQQSLPNREGRRERGVIYNIRRKKVRKKRCI